MTMSTDTATSAAVRRALAAEPTILEAGPHLARELRKALREGPVLVLPAGYSEPGPPRHVGVAYDGTVAAEAALDAAFAVAGDEAAALTLYRAVPAVAAHPDDPGTGAQGAIRAVYEHLDAAAERAPAGVNPERKVVHGAAAAAIANEAAGIVDLLVVGSRRLGSFKRALLGGTSTKVVDRAPFPVLVVPEG